MPNSRRRGGKSELKEDEIVQALVPKPEDVPDSTLVVGFLGRSEDQDAWRIYITPTLDNYIEVKKADILNAVPLETAENPIGGTAVWLKKSAKVRQSRTRTREVQASFLKGNIVSRHARQGSSGVAPFGISPYFALRTTGGTIGSFLNPPCAYGAFNTMALSCVAEFCEFVPATFLPDEVACTWEAECP